jgi:hypothetical protein
MFLSRLTGRLMPLLALLEQIGIGMTAVGQE